MTLVSFVDLGHSYGGMTVFEPVTGIIRRGDRIGVVGPNGAGKSTFCRLLSALERPDTGQVHLDRLARVHYMEQEPRFEHQERGVIDELLASCRDLKELERRLEDYQRRMEAGEVLDETELERYGDWLERFHRLEGWNLRARAEKILTGVGLGPRVFDQPVQSLSGGQKSRLSLAKALIAEPDLLFLDEPTNHLDLRAIEFLEDYLLETHSTVVVISHDRAFLQKVTSRTIEILHGRVTLFPGSYEDYAAWAGQEAERLEREHANYERKVEQLEDFIRRNIYGQKSRQAQSRRKALSRMKAPDAVRREARAPRWRIGVEKESASLVLEGRELAKGYPGREPLFAGLDFILMRGETMAVIGDNGTGKSTLLQLMAGRLLPDRGTIQRGQDVSIALLPQHVARPGDHRQVLEFMASQAPGMTIGQLREYLARFLFTGEQVEQTIDTLSEGEFRRLLLAGLINSGANLLLLDEPTNHLDIYSREALQRALEDYPGTVVLISHDRELLASLATRLMEFNSLDRAGATGDKIVEYDGDYAYYKQERARRERERSERQSAAERKTQAPSPEQNQAPDGARTLSKNELRRLKERRQQLEEEIARLEQEKAGLELRLSDPETYRRDGLATELVAGVDRLSGRIEQAYQQWEQLVEYD